MQHPAHLKPGDGAKHERHDAAQRPIRLKPPDHVAKDPDKAGGVQRASTPVDFDGPQPVFAVEKGDVEAPNPGMVEAKRKAEWPPRGLATEPEYGPDHPPREALCERDPNVLKRTGTCKPECEPTTLKSAAPGHLEVKMSHSEGERPPKAFADPKGPHFEATATEQRTRPSSTEEDTLHRQKQVRTDGIGYTNAHSPSFPFPIVLGHSCSAYPRSFRARVRRHHCQRWSWSCERQGRAASHASPSHASRAHSRTARTAIHCPFIRVPPHQMENISLQSRTMCEMRGSVGI